MQTLTAAPRQDLTDAQVRELLTRPDVTFAAGLDLVDAQNQLLEDISEDLAATPVISWDNRTAVHGVVRLSLQRELVWGRDRIRPYTLVSGGGITARFNCGVYVPTTPDTVHGESPATWEITGYDLLSLLQSTGPADTWVADAETTYLAAIRDALDASGIGLALLLDGTAQDTVIPATRVWAPTSQGTSWLRIVTDLLAEIGYTAPWTNENGALRARPNLSVVSRPVDWVLDTNDENTNLVYPDRRLVTEAGNVANWWRFVRTNMATPPAEGDGIYTVQNASVGPASQDRLGYVIRRWVPLEAADQASLVSQGDRIVAEDMASTQTLTLSIDPLPIMGFADVFQLLDDGTSEKLEAASWELHTDGTAGQLVLGGTPADQLAPVEAQAMATVTDAAPLRVLVDGATMDSFANALDGATYEIGDRVTVLVRNPLPPLVQGVES